MLQVNRIAQSIRRLRPDVFVVEPPDLREAVIRLLLGARSVDGPSVSGAGGTTTRLNDEAAESVPLDLTPLGSDT